MKNDQKLWGGRFSKSTDKLTEEFNQSITVDQRLYAEDISGSIAHATMLGKQSIIEQSEAELICATLAEIKADIEAGKVEFTIANEDIHMNIEAELIARIGDVGKKLHTARSRNDQVALDCRLYVVAQAKAIAARLTELRQCLVVLAQQHIDVIMPGYTHLQRAQPILFSHHLMAYYEMFGRDIIRVEQTAERANISPLGQGALAGTTFPLDRDFVAQQLGMSGITANSLDAVSDRDFALDMLYSISVIMMHISRFAEEIVIWSSSEFGFIELDDAFSTGSSIMPQKKNPDIAELSRGKCGRTFGNLIALLTTMKGLPLAYNKDMQEDKEGLFDSIDTALLTLPIFTKMLETMAVKSDNMRTAAAGGFTNATDMADYLVGKGVPFRDAHEVAGKLVGICHARGIALEQLTLDEMRATCDRFGDDIYDAISLTSCVNRRDVPGGTATNRVLEQIGKA